MYVGDFGISKPILAEQSGMHSRLERMITWLLKCFGATITTWTTKVPCHVL